MNEEKDLFGEYISSIDISFDTDHLYDVNIDWFKDPDQMEFDFDEKKVGLDIKQMLDKTTNR